MVFREDNHGTQGVPINKYERRRHEQASVSDRADGGSIEHRYRGSISKSIRSFADAQRASDERYDQGHVDENRRRILLHQGQRRKRAKDPCRQEHQARKSDAGRYGQGVRQRPRSYDNARACELNRLRQVRQECPPLTEGSEDRYGAVRKTCSKICRTGDAQEKEGNPQKRQEWEARKEPETGHRDRPF